MPAGVGWSQYLKFFTAAMLSMVVGAQTVHLYYKPLDDINILVDQQIQKLKKNEKISLDSAYDQAPHSEKTVTTS